MEGTVVITNHQRGMYCVELNDGSYTVFELLDSNEINQEDTISGNLKNLGTCTLINRTEDERFEAYVQNVGLNLKTATIQTGLV